MSMVFFQNQYKATIGVDFAFKHVQYDDKTSIKIQLWDVAGQERFSEMTRVYYKEAVAVLVFFDVTAGEKSMRSTINWKNDVDKKVYLPDGSPVPCILVGNKLDLVQDGVMGELSEELLSDFVMKNGYEQHFLTSAKDGTNVNEAMNFLIAKAVSCMRRVVEEEAKNANNNLAKNNNASSSITLHDTSSSSIRVTQTTANNTRGNTGSGGANVGGGGGCC